MLLTGLTFGTFMENCKKMETETWAMDWEQKQAHRLKWLSGVAAQFLADYNRADSLQERGESLGEEDQRTVTDLLIEMARARLTKRDGREELARAGARYAEIVRDLGLPDSALEPIATDLTARLALPPDAEDLADLAGRKWGEDQG